jgi:hypothetical protein
LNGIDQVWAQVLANEASLPFVLLDAAGFERGRAQFPDSIFSSLECLFSGDLADELEDVAPYLGQLASVDADVKDTIDDLLMRQLAILVQLGDDAVSFSELHRHLRKFNVVYGPEGNPLFFRYYDSRVLVDVLNVLDAGQRDAFFGPIASLVLAPEPARLVRCFRRGAELAVVA